MEGSLDPSVVCCFKQIEWSTCYGWMSVDFYRNLGRKTKIGTDGEGLPPPSQEEGTRSTNLSPLAMTMVMSRFDASEENVETEENAVTASDIEGLTQAYCLVEKESTSPANAAAYSVMDPAGSFPQAELVEFGVGRGASAFSDAVEPQGLSQLFYLDPATEEAVAQSIAEPSPSFLREKLGVPGTVVQDLRQVGEGVSSEAGRWARIHWSMFWERLRVPAWVNELRKVKIPGGGVRVRIRSCPQ